MTTHRRRPARGGAWVSLPWQRAPLLLLRQRVVFLAIVGAAAVLAVAAASGPLFLSTLGIASLHAQAEHTCPENAAPTMSADVATAVLSKAQRSGLTALARHRLPHAYSAAIGETRVQATGVHLFARPGALDHVQRLTARNGAGAWIPDTFARGLGYRPGSTITTVRGARIRVAGVYRDLAPSPFEKVNLPPYWCKWSEAIVPTAGGGAASGPGWQQAAPLLIVDTSTVSRVADDSAFILWSVPMSTQTHTLDEFDAAQQRLQSAAADVEPTAEPAGDLATASAVAHASKGGLAGVITPIEVAGVLVAILLVGGAGAFWASARRREIRLLVARGVGPGALAAKAVLETGGPAMLGAAAGYALAAFLVRSVGPARVFDAHARTTAAAAVAAALAVGLAVVAIIGAGAGRERTTGRRRGWPARIPWELGLIAGAVVLDLLYAGESAISLDHTIVSIRPEMVLYPVLGAAGVVLFAARVFGAGLPVLGRLARRLPPAAYLALRGAARSRTIVVGLIVGTALPCVLLMYGSSVRDTVRREVTAKYQTNLGAPHVLQVIGVGRSVLDLGDRGTQVVVYDDPATDLDGGGFAVVIGIDPSRFADFAFTTDAQRAAVAHLHEVGAGAAVPAILVHGNAHPRELRVGASTLRLDEVASSAVFPGLRYPSAPMVVVDVRSLSRIDPAIERDNQFWTDDAHVAAARSFVDARHYSILNELTSQILISTTGLLPVTWVFGYLRALAILVGVVALAGLVFGLAARTRSRRVSYVLSRRMGLRRGTHLRSLLGELGVVLGLGWAGGSALGIGALALIRGRLDVYPSLPPGPASTVPLAVLGATAATTGLAVVLAALATHLLAERTRPAEILRLE
ncbi:MAG: FtsX-like permease family protein [Jatrophihabitans sp.]